MKEALVKRKVSALLKEHAPYVRKFMPVQSGYGAADLDYIVCAYGHYVSIETKTTGKKMTPRQENTAKEIEFAGGTVFRNVDSNESIEEISTFLNKLRDKYKDLMDDMHLEMSEKHHADLPDIDPAQEDCPTVITPGN